MKHLIISFCSLAYALSALGQTFPVYSDTGGVVDGLEQIQSPVDVAFTSIRGAFDFDFVCLTDLPAGQPISFGVDKTANNSNTISQWSSNNKYALYVAPDSGVPAGSVIAVDDAQGNNPITCTIYYSDGTSISGNSAATAGTFSIQNGFNNWDMSGGNGVEFAFLSSVDHNTTNPTMQNTLDYFTVNGPALVGSPIEAVTGGIVTTRAYLSNGLNGNSNFPQNRAFYFELPAGFTSGAETPGLPGLLSVLRTEANWIYQNANRLTTVSLPPMSISSFFADNAIITPAELSTLDVLGTDIQIDLNCTLAAGGDFGFNKKFIIGSGGNVNVGSGAIKRFKKNVECSGSIAYASTSDCFFDGSVAQSVSGVGEFFNVTFDNPAGVTVSNNGSGVAIRAGGRLNVSQGNVSNTEPLILKSDASGTGALGNLTTDFPTGGLTVERFIAASTTDTWLMIGNLAPGVTAAEVLTQAGSPFPLYRFDATTQAWVPLTGATTLGSPLDTPTASYDGYLLRMPASATDVTLQFVSALSSVIIPADAPITIPLVTGLDQWNLVMNPFMTPISVAELFIANPNLPYISIYEGTQAIYRSATDVANDFAVIDVGQAFWVRGTTTLEEIVIPVAAKSDINGAFLRTTNPDIQGALKIVAFENDNSEMDATSYVSFRSAGEVGFDPTDATYMSSMSSSRFEIWTQIPGVADEKFCVQSQGDLAHTTEIPFVIKTNLGGSVTLSLDGAFDLHMEGACARLRDNETGNVWQLSDSSEIELVLDASTTYEDRFELLFSSLPMVSTSSGCCQGGMVSLDMETSGLPQTISLMNLETQTQFDLDTEDLSGLDPGNYVLSLAMGDGCAQTVDFTVSECCMGDIEKNNNRDVLDLMSLLMYIGMDIESYNEIDAKGVDCDCDYSLTSLDIIEWLSVFGTTCE